MANSLDISGDYFLTGVREMASGILLRPDSTFEFFFTYGALDRQGKGEWTLADNDVILNSKPWPGYDFQIKNQEAREQDGISLQLEAGNPVLARYCYAAVNETNNGEGWKEFNQRGELHFPPSSLNTLHLACEFISERQTEIAITNPSVTHLDITIAPWLFEYFFNGFRLQVTPDTLTGGHPMLKGDTWVYNRQS